tara:strand:- start:583 stop:690 length:108 start_codon:yes stop_codon:yes gene_type:complete
MALTDYALGGLGGLSGVNQLRGRVFFFVDELEKKT